MSLMYAYICLKTQRVFRTVPGNIDTITARLEDVLVLQISEQELNKLHPVAWVWGRGFYQDTNPLSSEEIERLQILNDRCFSLETLYRNVSLWRQNFVLNIPFNNLAEDLLCQEAESYIATMITDNIPLLSRYSASLNLDLHSAAKLALLAREEKRACIVTTELFKIEWENRLLLCAVPSQEMELLKEAYPIF